MKNMKEVNYAFIDLLKRNENKRGGAKPFPRNKEKEKMTFKKLRKTLEDMGYKFNDYTYIKPNYFTSRYCIEFLKDGKTVLEIEKRRITYIRKEFLEPFAKLGIKVDKPVKI